MLLNRTVSHDQVHSNVQESHHLPALKKSTVLNRKHFVDLQLTVRYFVDLGASHDNGMSKCHIRLMLL